jgi:hypothetical protein
MQEICLQNIFYIFVVEVVKIADEVDLENFQSVIVINVKLNEGG